ncbi:MAG: acetylxylan esterase, partial [Bacteroidales bacterium]|nr:acetylxylan esterase [Bacteroidales bacterium]
MEERKRLIDNLQSEGDWLKRQSYVREKLLAIIGPFPEKTPLNIHITGVIQREGYRVEKLIYESQPGYYVTSALFIPDNLQGRAPAILNPIGHSTMSFRRDIYQHTIINLVKKGFIVLTYDQIGQGERLQYYEAASGKSRFGSTDEHSYPGAQCFISGYSPAKYFIWDGIRGIDVLLSRKEVDPDRIGLTGLSGGGTSTAFIGAVDDRILAAAPECFITNFNYLLRSRGPQDAEQNLFQFIYQGLDHPDLIEARAPKPTLISSTTRDFFSIQGARETFQEAGKAFTALGEGSNLEMTEEDHVHGFTRKNREAMYAFFQKHLDNPGDASDHEVEVIPVEEFWVTETGQLATSLKGETIYSLNKKVVDKQVAELASKRTNIKEHLSGIKDAAARISGYSYPGETDQEIFSGRYVNNNY